MTTITDEDIDELFGSPLLLLGDEEKAERRAAAADPATPGARLMDLLEDHPEAVLDNPGLMLAVLEDPALWQQVHPRARPWLAQSPRCPEGFARMLLDGPKGELRTELLRNPGLPAALRREAFFRRYASYGPLDGCSEELPALTQVLAADELDLLVRSGLLEPLEPVTFRPRGPIDAERLAALGGIGAALALRLPDCPVPLLERLLTAKANHATRIVPMHPNLSDDALARLVADALDGDRLGTRYALRSHPRLTPAQRAALA